MGGGVTARREAKGRVASGGRRRGCEGSDDLEGGEGVLLVFMGVEEGWGGGRNSGTVRWWLWRR